MSIRRKRGVGLVTLLVAGAVAMGSYAFTTSNTLPAVHRVGEGDAATSGFAVSHINWTASATDLSKVTFVEFDLDNAADIVKVQTAGGAGAPTGTVYKCDTGVGTGVGSGVGNHDYTLDDPSAYPATHTVTATSTHPVCDLDSTGGGIANSGVTYLTVYADAKSS